MHIQPFNQERWQTFFLYIVYLYIVYLLCISGIPPLCHAPLSPQLSPNQTVPIATSPMYAGSPPGLAQVNSPYQPLHHSPSGVGSPQQQPMQSYAQMPQAFSPHRTPQSNIISPSHQGQSS